MDDEIRKINIGADVSPESSPAPAGQTDAAERLQNIENRLKHRRRRRRLRRLAGAALLLVLVLAVTLGTVTGIVWLRRQLKNGTLEELIDLNRTGTAVTRITGSVNSIESMSCCRACWQDGLATVSTTRARYLTEDGKEGFEAEVVLSQPALAVNGDYFLCYDLDGTGLYLFDCKGLVAEAQTPDKLLSATVSPGGVVCALCESDTCLSTLSVYSPKLNCFFSWSNTARYLISAAYCDETGTVLVASVYDRDYVLYGRMLTLDTNLEGIQRENDLGEVIPYGVFSYEDGFAVMTSGSVLYTGKDGLNFTKMAFYGEVEAYEYAGEGCFYILANSESSEYLLRLDKTDERSLQINRSETVGAIACGGGMVGVLYRDRVVLYDSYLNESRVIYGQNISGLALIKSGTCVLFYDDNVEIV